WGYLCLHREDSQLGFTAAEIALIGRLAPHVAHGLRQAVLLSGASGSAAERGPGVVVLGDGLDVVAITCEAERLLSLVGSPRTPRSVLPIAVLSAAAALR